MLSCATQCKHLSNATQHIRISCATQTTHIDPAVLHIVVDDLGNFGCYGACDSDVPYPLYVEANATIMPFTGSLTRSQ